MEFNEIFRQAPWYVRMSVIRMLRGLTKQQAAEKVGTSYCIYKTWESGNHYPIKLNRQAICKTLGVPEELIFG